MDAKDLWAAIEAAGPLAGFATFDPLLVDDVLQAERSTAQYDRRRAFYTTYAWAVPSPLAVERIAAAVGDRKVLEIFAGNGLWARLLTGAGLAVVSTDGVAPNQPWYPVEVLEATAAVERNPDCPALFLSWPPFRDHSAFLALEAFKGDLVIFAGDPSFTADDDFHTRLRECWTLVDEVSLPSWPGTSDTVRIYSRSPLPGEGRGPG